MRELSEWYRERRTNRIRRGISLRNAEANATRRLKGETVPILGQSSFSVLDQRIEATKRAAAESAMAQPAEEKLV